MARNLLKRLKYPLAAPSANLSSKVSAVCSSHVKEDFGKKIRFILEGGKSSVGVESTIIDIRNKPRILRLGGLDISTIKKVLNKKISMANNPLKISAPGQSRLHYSPGIPIRLNVQRTSSKKEAYLLIKKRNKSKSNYYYLSKNGNLKEAAKNLYHTLRKLKK